MEPVFYHFFKDAYRQGVNTKFPFDYQGTGLPVNSENISAKAIQDFFMLNGGGKDVCNEFFIILKGLSL